MMMMLSNHLLLPFSLLVGSSNFLHCCVGFQSPTASKTSSYDRLITKERTPEDAPLLAVTKVEKTEEEWRDILRPDQFDVLRRDGTEPPNSSRLNDVKDDGTFLCAGCNSPLFITSTKYESGSGWPSFYAPIDTDSIELSVDFKAIIPRTEVTCKCCGGHLGHVFEDGPQPTGKRYCMNGVAMKFVSDETDADLTQSVLERTSTGGGLQIKQPLMAIIPSIAFDAVVAALFISSFLSRNNGNGGGLALFSNGVFGLSQIWGLLPLGIGVYYAASALQKAASLGIQED